MVDGEFGLERNPVLLSATGWKIPKGCVRGLEGIMC